MARKDLTSRFIAKLNSRQVSVAAALLVLGLGIGMLIYPVIIGNGKAPGLAVSKEDNILGSPNAPITIVEYGDFGSTGSARFYKEVLPEIKSEYVESGELRFVFKHFPQTFSPDSKEAAQAAECAADQGRFWDYHDKLFENQEDWKLKGISEFKTYASELGLDQSEFNSCLDKRSKAAEVNADYLEGQKLGVIGAPTFFVNDKKLSGFVTLKGFEKLFD